MGWRRGTLAANSTSISSLLVAVTKTGVEKGLGCGSLCKEGLGQGSGDSRGCSPWMRMGGSGGAVALAPHLFSPFYSFWHPSPQDGTGHI